jgi:hypothetical protein
MMADPRQAEAADPVPAGVGPVRVRWLVGDLARRRGRRTARHVHHADDRRERDGGAHARQDAGHRGADQLCDLAGHQTGAGLPERRQADQRSGRRRPLSRRTALEGLASQLAPSTRSTPPSAPTSLWWMWGPAMRRRSSGSRSPPPARRLDAYLVHGRLTAVTCTLFARRSSNPGHLRRPFLRVDHRRGRNAYFRPNIAGLSASECAFCPKSAILRSPPMARRRDVAIGRSNLQNDPLAGGAGRWDRSTQHREPDCVRWGGPQRAVYTDLRTYACR